MKKRTVFCILFALSFCCRMMAASGVFDVRDFGAKGDGKTLDHGAINKIQQRACILSGSKDAYGMNTKVQSEEVGSAWSRGSNVWDDDEDETD